HSGERYVFQIVDLNDLKLKKLIEKANAGDPEALKNLGDRYYYGSDHVSEDKVKAAELYRKSADQGYAEGQYNLGKCYYFGKGVPLDRAEAAKWFQKAALRGHEDATEKLEFLNESDK
ncbi:MAG: sel1 repeat family protein, partial [Thermoguttaceae bacterium]|nr:sel1 repeat family protein [Thermoguttaceae bacterium]